PLPPTSTLFPYTTLFRSLGGSSSFAVAVNATGKAVGWSWISPNEALAHAFSWTQVGGMIDLGTLGGSSSFAVAVNASGQVVGTRSEEHTSELQSPCNLVC